MKMLSLLGVLATTLLTGCNPKTNVLLKTAPKYLVTDMDIVSVSDINNVIQISANVRDNNMINCNNLTHSITFIGNTDYHGFNGANHVTYNWGELEYDVLDSDIQTTTQDLAKYYFGFLDYKFQFYSSGVANRSGLIRQYFVNPKVLNNGVYYIDDKTWHKVYDIYTAGNDNYSDFGKWLSYYDYLNYQWDYGSFTYDDLIDDLYEFYITTLFNAHDIPSFSLLDSVEPQRHYGDTYSINGSLTGQNLNSNYISFLPYLYFYFCDDGGNLGDLYGLSNELSLYHYKQDYSDSYDAGYNAGKEDGNREGYQSGYDAGYDEGWDGGYEDGYGTGVGDGYEQGYQVGDAQGYTTGYNQGTSDANQYNFPVLFASIADTPVLIFRSLFNFDLFGTSALVVIMSIFTALIIIFIAKKIIK